MNIDNLNLKKEFEKYKLNISESELKLFEQFLCLFKEKNSVLNLSAIRDEIWIVEKHFVDSIFLNNFINLSWKVLDIWTWWGFPGIPLAIINPEAEFILLDSTRKKIDSVNEFAKNLNLENCSWIWWRAEELSSKMEYYQKFDSIVSRATAYLPKIIEWSYPFLKDNWKMYIYKLQNAEEIQDWRKILSKMNLKISNIFHYEIDSQQRIILEISK